MPRTPARSNRTLTPLAILLAAGLTACGSDDPATPLATVQAQLQTEDFELNVGEESTVDLSVAAMNAAVVDSITWESTSPANLEIINAPTRRAGSARSQYGGWRPASRTAACGSWSRTGRAWHPPWIPCA